MSLANFKKAYVAFLKLKGTLTTGLHLQMRKAVNFRQERIFSSCKNPHHKKKKWLFLENRKSKMNQQTYAESYPYSPEQYFDWLRERCGDPYEKGMS